METARTYQTRFHQALAEQRRQIAEHPKDIALLNATAWTLATNPNASVRNGAEAVALAERAVELSNGKEPSVLGTLAAAYAEVDRFDEAAQTAQKAIDLATEQNKQAVAEPIRAKLPLYQRGIPFREKLQPTQPAATPQTPGNGKPPQTQHRAK